MSRADYILIYRSQQGVERVYHLTKSLLIGRSASCQVVLDDEGVSRQHCELRCGRAGVTLKDRDSTNGTYLNGSKVREAAVCPGDRIVVGQACLVLRAADDPRPEELGARTSLLGDTTVEVVLRAAAEKRPDATVFRDAALDGDVYRALYHVTELLNSSDTAEQILEGFLPLVMELYAMDLGAVFLVESPGEAPRCRCEIDRTGMEAHRPSRSVLEQVLRDDVSVVAHDPLSDPRFAKARSIADSGASLILCVPLRATGRIIGALYLSSVTPGTRARSAGESSLQILVALASQAAHGLENMRYRDRLERDNTILRQGVASGASLVGSSAAMARVRVLIDKVAGTEATVLVTGESGTGKELVAAAIHDGSRRRGRPMVSINCGAIPETMVEAELFGHEKGAFTGAVERKLGRFELAHEGTLFLDEVGELPLQIQVKLLRVLEEKRLYRVGGEELVPVDARIIAATNANLERMVAEKRFRQDLFYRLQVFQIAAPPLREHPEDIAEIAAQLLENLSGRPVSIAPSGIERLESYLWPGNVRELRNVLERELILAEEDELRFEALDLLEIEKRPAAAVTGQRVTLEQVARQHILVVLRSAGWNKKKAAAILGISRPTLYDKIKHFDIEEDE